MLTSCSRTSLKLTAGGWFFRYLQQAQGLSHYSLPRRFACGVFYHSANSSNLISPSPFLSSVSITSSSCFFVTPA